MNRAAGLLLLPATWLLRSWAPDLANGADAGDWLIFGALVVPATVAAAIFVRQFLRGLIAAGSR